MPQKRQHSDCISHLTNVGRQVKYEVLALTGTLLATT
jgi:hypothetical protein